MIKRHPLTHIPLRMENPRGIVIMFLLILQSCVGPMTVKHATKKSFAVPSVCNMDMTVHKNISPCVRALLPLGEHYGAVAVDRLDAVEGRVPDDKVSQAMEARTTIKEKCLGTAKTVRALYDAGRTDEASETGAQALMKCFFYGRSVLSNFGAGKQGKRLSNAASRAYWGLFLNDDFLIPPPDLYLGPIT